ncbi:MAG: PspA/IM30 family protein, partial [Thermoanaerobaculia bacterium]|nr:PspA/IM30 family protein [Thermoanaerobaculia bacterium]
EVPAPVTPVPLRRPEPHARRYPAPIPTTHSSGDDMFTRLMNVFRGFLSLFVTGLEKANPKALIEAEKENLRAQIARFNENLAQHAGFCERLMRQIKQLEAQEKELVAKAAANLKVGNRDAAGQYALQLQTVKAQLEENRGQLVEAEKTYQNLLTARDVTVREAKAKIQKLERMLSETEMLEAQAELQEMASGMISSIAGRARVASGSMDMGDVQVKVEEQKALADQALAEFASAYGIDMPAPEKAAAAAPAAPAPTPIKEMGPSGS